MRIIKTIPLVNNTHVIGSVDINVCIQKGYTALLYADTLKNSGSLDIKGNVFYALGELSNLYLEKNIKLACKGCTLYAFSSGLTSESSMGEIVLYVDGSTSMKKAPRVNIFDVLPKEEFYLLSSFIEQKNERRRLINLLRLSRPPSK